METGAVHVVRCLLEQSDDPLALLARGELHSHPSLELFHPDVEVEELADVPGARRYRGRDGVVCYFEELEQLWERVVYRAREFIAVGDDAVVVDCELTGRSRAGVDATMTIYQVYRVRDGMIAWATAFLERDAALAAAAGER